MEKEWLEQRAIALQQGIREGEAKVNLILGAFQEVQYQLKLTEAAKKEAKAKPKKENQNERS